MIEVEHSLHVPEDVRHVLLERGVEGARGVDLADGEVRRRLLADEHVHRVVRLLADERDEAQEQLRVRPDGGQLQG